VNPILRNIIEEAKEQHEASLKHYTVLSKARDPYRIDTPVNHAVGKWLVDALEEVEHNTATGRIHLRGLHYKLVGRVFLPNGDPYINSDGCWLFLSDKAAKAARFLGYLPWEAIKDARNSEPLVYRAEQNLPVWGIRCAGVEVELPDDLAPEFYLGGDLHYQPYQQIVIAEKSGVIDLLKPVCQSMQATLATPAGEISDTMVYDLLRAANDDGRPLVVHQLGDFDPAGWQMAVSTSRTIQALVDTQFPDLDVTVHATGLTRDHCEEWDLPSTPLKDTELRGTNWKKAMGWEQTELDSAIALKPDQFEGMVRDALTQYHDPKVAAEARDLRFQLEDEANARLADTLGGHMAEIEMAMRAKLEELESKVKEVNDALNIDPFDFGIETPETPEALIGDTNVTEEPLIETFGDWAEQSRRLIERKQYGASGGSLD
jgi:hypothetical protein